MSESLKIARKYLGQKVPVTVDRPLGSRHPKHGFVYECNYGFIEGVKAPDGEDLDAYLLGIDEPVSEALGICIAIAHRQDDDDDKLIVVPEDVSISDDEIIKAIHFQEQWFNTVLLRE